MRITYRFGFRLMSWNLQQFESNHLEDGKNLCCSLMRFKKIPRSTANYFPFFGVALNIESFPKTIGRFDVGVGFNVRSNDAV